MVTSELFLNPRSRRSRQTNRSPSARSCNALDLQQPPNLRTTNDPVMPAPIYTPTKRSVLLSLRAQAESSLDLHVVLGVFPCSTTWLGSSRSVSRAEDRAAFPEELVCGKASTAFWMEFAFLNPSQTKPPLEPPLGQDTGLVLVAKWVSHRMVHRYPSAPIPIPRAVEFCILPQEIYCSCFRVFFCFLSL
jgi:hypothetical protein